MNLPFPQCVANHALGNREDGLRIESEGCSVLNGRVCQFDGNKLDGEKPTWHDHTASSLMTLSLLGRVTEQKMVSLAASSLTSTPFSFVKKNDICGGAVSEPLKVVN